VLILFSGWGETLLLRYHRIRAPEFAVFSRGRSVVRPKRLNFPIFVKRLEESLVQRIERTCKRIYRVLAISGYARIDLRLTPDNEIYFLEANPNPHLANDEDFAESAKKADLPYPGLIARIIELGLRAVRA
jgi:hypothetical protein